MSTSDALKLAADIDTFLAKYGKRDASDPREWNGPDSAELEFFATVVKSGKQPDRVPWSMWGSGCYKPFSSKEGEAEHKKLLERCAAHVGVSRR